MAAATLILIGFMAGMITTVGIIATGNCIVEKKQKKDLEKKYKKYLEKLVKKATENIR